MARTYSVNALDFSEFALRTLGPSDTHVLLKLDVESAEYQLLPRLLTSGVLCRASHLIVEWHLAHASPADRLACLAFKLSLPMQLERGCPRPPRLVQEEFRLLNADARVPGLLEQALVHMAPGKYTVHGTVPRWKTNYSLALSKRAFKHTGVTMVNGL